MLARRLDYCNCIVGTAPFRRPIDYFNATSARAAVSGKIWNYICGWLPSEVDIDDEQPTTSSAATVGRTAALDTSHQVEPVLRINGYRTADVSRRNNSAASDFDES